MTRRHLLTLVALLWVACLPVPTPGGPCADSGDCDLSRGFECVVVDGDAVCMPVLLDRGRTGCARDFDCTAAFFPVEATCQAGACRCDALPCDVDDEEVPVVFDPVGCLCVASDGGEGEFCVDSDDCAAGLNCREQKCGEGQFTGDACDADHGCGGTLVCDLVKLECRFDDGDACSEADQCTSAAPFCVNAHCSNTQGFSGDGCTEDGDCEPGFDCTDGTC